MRQLTSSSSRTLRFVALSSTTSTCRPSTMLAGRGAATGSRWTPNRATNRNRLPRPGSLVSQIRPPIISTRCAEMVRPSPVPPNRRVVDVSACTNAPKICHCLSSGIPMPVSETMNRSAACSVVTLSADTSTTTSPVSVNLTALPTRLTSTCRRRPGSPTRLSGTSVLMRQASSSPFSCAGRANSRTAPSTASRRLNGIASSASRPASTFETSRTSFRMPSSASADSFAVRMYSR